MHLGCACYFEPLHSRQCPPAYHHALLPWLPLHAVVCSVAVLWGQVEGEREKVGVCVCVCVCCQLSLSLEASLTALHVLPPSSLTLSALSIYHTSLLALSVALVTDVVKVTLSLSTCQTSPPQLQAL